jgi:hypothetical protein
MPGTEIPDTDEATEVARMKMCGCGQEGLRLDRVTTEGVFRSAGRETLVPSDAHGTRLGRLTGTNGMISSEKNLCHRRF